MVYLGAKNGSLASGDEVRASVRSWTCGAGRVIADLWGSLGTPSVAPEGGWLGGCGDHGAGRTAPEVDGRGEDRVTRRSRGPGGKAAVVARRHQVSERLLYNGRSAWKAAAGLLRTAEPAEFVPIGVIGRRCWQLGVHRPTPAHRDDRGRAAERRAGAR